MTTNRCLGTGALLTLALAAGAAPASAMPNQFSPASAPVVQSPYGSVPSPAALTRANVVAALANAPASPPATIVRITAHGGFDWGDAGIGAAGGLALAVVGLGGALAVSQRHSHTHGHRPVA